MQVLIEAIRVAVASDASTEQKATGVQACRTIVAALDTEPGKPIALPGMPLPAATSRVSVDQILDLTIARLATIATAREAEPALRGLRVPVTPTALPPAPTKPSNHRAFTNRGSIELDDGTRWPRTTGEQVAATAAAFTPAIRANVAPRVVMR
ncbi:MAG: hypothetical protein ABI305_00055 [Tepidiformaceae bacterium]